MNRYSQRARQGGACLIQSIVLAIVLLVVGGGLAAVLWKPSLLPEGIGVKKVPMTASFRKSMLSQGVVAEINNPTNTVLHDVRVVGDLRATGKQKELFKEQWNPEESADLGWLEGWKLEPGDTLTITASGLRKRVWTVPELGG